MVAMTTLLVQGCQIFVGATYQSGEKYTKITLKHTKWPQNIPNGCKKPELPTSSIARPSKIPPTWDFWFKNMPSGNPAQH
jgi:hypothetical protein